MEKFINHWKTSFDWRKQEKELNKFPQFKTKIEGIDVHFLHIKPSKGKKGTQEANYEFHYEHLWKNI